MRHLVLLATVLTAVFLITPAMGFAHGELVNDSDKSIPVLSLMDSQGKPFAKLFMSGKEMTINHYNYPDAGAGYYEALEGNHCYIPFTIGGLGGLLVDRVEWDDKGRTISIKGLRPYFESGEKMRITSDVNNPKLRDGILYLKLAGKGNVEYQFRIMFGIGVYVEPPLHE